MTNTTATTDAPTADIRKPETILTPEQLRRAGSLIVAKDVLTGTAAPFGSKENNRDAEELMRVAEYIVTGPTSPAPTDEPFIPKTFEEVLAEPAARATAGDAERAVRPIRDVMRGSK